MFWENYDYLCRKIGKSANSVAAECGVRSTGTVSAWKKGALPNAKTLTTIAKYFNVSVEDLTGPFIPAKQKAPSKAGERVEADVANYLAKADTDLRFALYGEPADELTREDLNQIREYAEYVRNKRRGATK